MDCFAIDIVDLFMFVSIRFLQDAQRMNVALTRAKHSLILVVHAESLQVTLRLFLD